MTYGTNSEFGFDYLRDMGMARSKESLVQRDHYFVIIDEIDNILIDEARTPLIISGPVPHSTHNYDSLKPMIENLVKKQTRMCTDIIAKAREILDRPDHSQDEHAEAIHEVTRVKLGMPKHKQLLRLFENPELRREVEKHETSLHSDNNRGWLQETKDTLYFTMDEKAHDADLGEIGRTTLDSTNPDAFVIPDLATEFALIEGDSELSDDEKREKREQVQQEFDRQSERIHNISQLLRAYCMYERDRHYIVVDNKVIIVDEFTGRSMPGRRFGEGLHMALEAKEGVTIEGETQTMATVTIQNYFRMYEKLSGMTGTAETEANEFMDIYKLGVLVVPTNRF